MVDFKSISGTITRTSAHHAAKCDTRSLACLVLSTKLKFVNLNAVSCHVCHYNYNTRRIILSGLILVHCGKKGAQKGHH